MVAHLVDAGAGRRRVHRLWLRAFQSDHDGARRPVPGAGGAQGAEQFHPQVRDVVEFSAGA